MGVLTVDVTAFGVVMSADSQPVEALDGETRVLGQPGRSHTRNPILKRNATGFSGFTGFVGTEEIGGKMTRDWLHAFGARHPIDSLSDYAHALGQELTNEWQCYGLASVLEILISGVEDGDVCFWFVRNSHDRTPFVGPPRVRVGGGYGSRRKVAGRAVGSGRGRGRRGGSGDARPSSRRPSA